MEAGAYAVKRVEEPVQDPQSLAEQRMQALRDLGLLDDDATEPFDRLTRLTRRLLDVDTALISLVERDRQTFRGQDGLPPERAAERGTPISHSYCKFAVATGEPLVVTDARQSALLRDSPAIADHDVIAYAGIPLRLGVDGAVLGTLCVIESQPRQWTEEELDVLHEIAEIARTELEHRIRNISAERIEKLALRLPDPVTRLGDAVRTTASLVEQPDDPRLPRTVDVARGRFQVVETITADLAGAAEARHSTRRPEPELVDLRQRVTHAVELARSNARADAIVTRFPDPGEGPAQVRWVRRELDRALSLAVVTATHHARLGSPVEVSLELDRECADLRVVCPGNRVPVAELLRVVSAFQSSPGTGGGADHAPADAAESVDVAVRASGTRVRGAVAQAVAAADATTIVAQFPIVAGEPAAGASTQMVRQR